jgi:hypothetical protein
VPSPSVDVTHVSPAWYVAPSRADAEPANRSSVGARQAPPRQTVPAEHWALVVQLPAEPLEVDELLDEVEVDELLDVVLDELEEVLELDEAPPVPLVEVELTLEEALLPPWPLVELAVADAPPLPAPLPAEFAAVEAPPVPEVVRPVQPLLDEPELAEPVVASVLVEEQPPAASETAAENAPVDTMRQAGRRRGCRIAARISEVVVAVGELSHHVSAGAGASVLAASVRWKRRCRWW